jgi:site-specific DNA recombinase
LQNGHVRGVPPYGYVVVGGKLVENPKEQQLVQRVLTQWRSGKSFNAIAKTLNGQGVRTRSGKIWEHSIVRSIIQRNTSN